MNTAATERLPWSRSIRLKLVLGAVFVQLIMLALLLENSARLIDESLEGQTQTRLAALSPLIDASLSSRVFQRDYAEIDAILERLAGADQTDIRYIAVYDPARELLSSVGLSDARQVPPVDTSFFAALADRVFDSEIRLALGKEQVGWVRFGISLEALMASRDKLVRQGMWIAAAEIVLSLLLLIAGGYLITRHIPPLLAATRRIAAGDYALRVPVDSRDEIGVLAANFNAMTAAVEERVRELQISESRFREIFDSVGEAIFIQNPDTGEILDVNRRMCEMYGYSREQAIAQKDVAFFSAGTGPYSGTEAAAHLRRAIQEGPQTFEWYARAQDGRLFWVEVSLRLARIGDDDMVLAAVRDISERKQHQSELEYLAHHDPLTRLPNRLLLADRMAQAIGQSKRQSTLVAVGYLDLDGFKPINDELGHEAGDRLLVEVSGRLKSCIREGDTLSRFGGDEFVIVLAGLPSMDEGTKTFNRILEAVSQPYPLADRQLALSASIGVAVFPFDNSDPDSLIRHADQAMYAAKQAGRNRLCVFDPDRDFVSKTYQEARNQIEAALARREFVLHYQPKVDLRDGRVMGAEALIRWQHPQRGLVPPASFLPVIEGTDVAIALGRWVLGEAVRQLDEWRRAGLAMTISINVASHHLQSADFVADVSAVLAAHPGVPAAAVELELLETTALEDISRASRVIDECHRLGVRFALDDFGTGYASLSYFRSLQIDTLKVDQSFVRDMLDDRDDQAIVEGVISLARAFRRQVVAEGVETAAHCVALLNLGCHYAQGYGIARPMPAEDLTRWVRSRPVASST